MSKLDWRQEPLGKQHDRAAFDCGDEALNTWFARYARQSHDIGGAKTFVAVVETAPARVLGFYALSPASVAYAKVPLAVKRGLARHDVPMYRLGRLAVDLGAQGHGLGGALLLAAARRCMEAAEQVGGVALLIDAKNERVATWYESHGAVRIEEEPLSLALSFATLREAMK